MRELLQEQGFLEDDLAFSRVSLTIIGTADVATRLHPRLEVLFATYYLEYVIYFKSHIHTYTYIYELLTFETFSVNVKDYYEIYRNSKLIGV